MVICKVKRGEGEHPRTKGKPWMNPLVYDY